MHVENCRKTSNKCGQIITENSHYSPDENIIRMDEKKDDSEYLLTFCHEYGHFIDAQLKRPSLTNEFSKAIKSDLAQYDSNFFTGTCSFNEMLLELENSPVLDCRYVSDILSGMFHNSKIIRDVYYNAGAAFYHHKNEYWEGMDGPNMAVERETFANMFAIFTENNTDTLSFIKKRFPHITQQFKQIIGG